MYKYLCFVVLGIIIFLLYNRKETLNIGGQIEQSIEQLRNIVARIAMGMVDPGQQLCAIGGVGQCRILQDERYGSCTINALTGLVYTSASFTPKYQMFLNREYVELSNTSILFNTYRCTMNMPNMLATLESNKLNPKKTYSHTLNSSEMLNTNNEYAIKYSKLYLCFYDYNFQNIIFTKQSGNNEYGHAFLIYRIRKRKLGRLLEYMSENRLQGLDVGGHLFTIILENLRVKHTSMVDGSFGLLIIDFCNNIFDIITDESYPITTPAPEVRQRLVTTYTEDYNKMWKLKILWYWITYFKNIVIWDGYTDPANAITINSNDHKKDTFNQMLLDEIDSYTLTMFTTYKLQDSEEIEQNECEIEPVQNSCSVLSGIITIIPD